MKEKDKCLTVFSILFVICILILQSLLVYQLYRSNLDVLQRELSVVLDQAYSRNLGDRLEQRRLDQKNPNATFKYYGVGNDTTTNSQPVKFKRTHVIDGRMASDSLKADHVTFMNVGMEEYISQYYPLSVYKIDSLVDLYATKHHLSFDYEVKIFNPKTGEVSMRSKPRSEVIGFTLQSKEIPLNFVETSAIKLDARPGIHVLYRISWMLVLSFIFSLFCIYSLAYQLKTLARQRKLAQAKNDFFAEISHEFIRPLALLSQTIDSMRIEKNILDPQKRNLLAQMAGQEIKIMANKADMILSLARQEEGMLELNIQEFDLPKIVFDQCDNIRIVPPKTVEVDIDNELIANPRVFADKEHIEQVLSNLIGNALKYSDNNLELYIKMYREGNNVFLSVRDNGNGISPEGQNVVFQKYSRVDKNTTLKGHGIGLYYVKRIIEKHKGDVTLKSKLGEGSEFIIRLPQPKRR